MGSSSRAALVASRLRPLETMRRRSRPFKGIDFVRAISDMQKNGSLKQDVRDQRVRDMVEKAVKAQLKLDKDKEPGDGGGKAKADADKKSADSGSKLKHQFKFKKNVDLATTQLLNSMKLGETMPRAIITLFHRSTNAPVTLAITFKEVRLVQYDLFCRCQRHHGRPEGRLDSRVHGSRVRVPESSRRPPARTSSRRGRSACSRCCRKVSRACCREPVPMALTNYQDISPPAGDVGRRFQFQFTCESCGDTWKSPFKPYRAGQASGLLRRFSYIFGEFYRVGAINDMLGPRCNARQWLIDAIGRCQAQGSRARRSARLGC